MGTPTTTTSGAVCTAVIQQDHLNIDGTEDNGISTGTVFYLVTWSANANTSDCRGATDGTHSVPNRGDGHPYVTSLGASRIEIRAAEQNCRNKFQVRVEFSDDTDSLMNPLSQPPEITWDFSDEGQQPYFIDNDPAGAKPTVNKAGERFSDFLQRYTGCVSATFSKNIPITGSGAFNASTIISYTTPNPASNSDAFTFDGQPIGVGQAIIRGVNLSGTNTQNGVKYRTLKWSLAFKSSWLDKVDNRGFNALVTMDDGTNKLQEIIKGIPPVKPDSPWPLYPSGHAMPNVSDIPTPQLTFYPYKQMAYASLGFA